MRLTFRPHSPSSLFSRAPGLAFLASTLLFLLATGLHAQSSGAAAVPGWGGVLRDAAGLPVSGANVTLTGPSTLRTVTATDGSFRFLHPVPGAWTLTVRLPHRAPTAGLAVQIPGPTAIFTLTPANTLSVSSVPLPANITADQATRGAPAASSSPASRSASFRSTAATSALCCCSPPAP